MAAVIGIYLQFFSNHLMVSVLFSIELGPTLVEIIDGFLRGFHFSEGGLKAGSVTGDFFVFQSGAASDESLFGFGDLFFDGSKLAGFGMG